MRIPSGLNDGSLYRQRPGKRPEPSSNRRLLRLCLALALVLVAMNQAGKPAAYRIFFSEPATKQVAVSINTKNSSDGFSDSNEIQASNSSLQPLSRTIASLPEDARPQLTRILSRLRKDENADMTPGDESLMQTLIEASHAAGEPLSVSGNSPVLADQELRIRLQAAMDDLYLQEVDDGAIWTQSDNQAFYRLLEAGGRIGLNAPLPRQVGVVALLQQPDVYLHRRVLLTGTVARVSRLNSKSNDFGVEQYYELWLEPDDGSKRPVAFYSKTVTPAIEQILGVDFVTDGPKIDIEGVFLKRLAFRSQSGSELSPAIVGRIVASQAPMFAAPAATSMSSKISWEWPVALAAFIGIGGAFAIMFASRISARRSRERRLATQSVAGPDLTTFAKAQDTKAFNDVLQ